jgi:hypothetical protein
MSPCTAHRTVCAFLLVVFATTQAFAQDCRSIVVIRLENISGGVFQGRNVTLTSRADGRSFTELSAENGEATLTVPCNELFDLTIDNYTRKEVVESSHLGKRKHTFSYPFDMVQKEKALAMSPDEQDIVDKFFGTVPDTTVIKGSLMPPPKLNPYYYALFTIAIRDLAGAPLQNEPVSITGRKRNKTVKGITDRNGRLLVYVPKGDTYDMSFKYNKKYYSADCAFTRGNTDIRLGFSYMGTKETERRMKEEEERLRAEEKRLKDEREKFEKECKAMDLTLEECHRRKVEEYLDGEIGDSDTVITRVMKRNTRWQDKLIICDVTGSMSPYVAQLAKWYRLSLKKEPNLQFIFFNDGDNLSDKRKKIGDTGGIHYTRSKTIDSLDMFMSHIQSLGNGGDCAENNMEALIKGVKMAGPFRDILMIADNHAPVKDIRLLSEFNFPVHIILCGVSGGQILPDYLKIAWKTKGSIHTIEEDITALARMSEGQQIKIGGIEYRIMGGEFVAVKK